MRRRVFLFSWLVSCLGCGATPVPAPAASSVQPAQCDYYDYRFELDAALTQMTATVCFDGPPPPALVCGREGDPQSVPQAERISGEHVTALPTRGCHIDLSGLSIGDCVRYSVDLRAAARQMLMGFGAQSEAAVMTQTDKLLYVPSPRAPSIHGHATLSLPEHVSASLPWLRDADGYLLDRSAFEQVGYAVFGSFESEHVDVPGAALDVAIIDTLAPSTRAAIAPWLQRVAAAVSQLDGAFPADRAQVILIPQAGGGGVRFGMVGRGGGPSVMFVVGRESTESELIESWEPPHEFTHLRTPLAATEDRWLTEGIATYYQEVLRARSGITTAAHAWKRLHTGLSRGAAEGTGRTLRAESAAMFETGEFRRVYWAGVAFAWLADVELRRNSDNAISLDTVVSGLQACCANSSRTWTAVQTLQRMDELAGKPVFSTLAQQHLDQAAFPDVAATFSGLGITVGEGEPVLDPASPLAAVRDAIMAPVNAPSAPR